MDIIKGGTMKIILTALLLTGCIHPGMYNKKPMEWSQEEHENMLYSCKAACGTDRLFEYETITARCSCVQKREQK